MIHDPSIFYDSYLKEYHKTKAHYLKWMLDTFDDTCAAIHGKGLTEKTKDEIRKTIKSDLRQTYFHAMETFFEIFFALNPQGKKTAEDRNVLLKLTNANWPETYRKIKSIAEDEAALDFLDQEIVFNNIHTTIGHYIFYMNLFRFREKSEEANSYIRESLEAIKYGIRIIAQEFTDREEYNAYKHALRIIPATTKLMFAEAKTMAVQLEWDLSDSMSYFSKIKDKDEFTVHTKLFDHERDYQMSCFCSNLIYNMVYYRKLAFRGDEKEHKDDKVGIRIFGKEAIDKCTKVNVEIQNLVWTTSRVKSDEQ